MVFTILYTDRKGKKVLMINFGRYFFLYRYSSWEQMAAVDKSDGSLLTYDEVNNLCKEIFEDTIGQTPYQHLEAVKWNTNIVEEITQKLVSLNPHFKYCVSSIIMQSGIGAGLNVASTCYWDRLTDSSYSIRWETKSVVAVCTIFAVSYATRM